MSKVAVVMGSTSDLPVMQDAIDLLKGFDIAVDVDLIPAHRTPEKLIALSKNAHTNGYSVIIAGAGGAAGDTRGPATPAASGAAQVFGTDGGVGREADRSAREGGR